MNIIQDIETAFYTVYFEHSHDKHRMIVISYTFTKVSDLLEAIHRMLLNNDGYYIIITLF